MYKNTPVIFFIFSILCNFYTLSLYSQPLIFTISPSQVAPEKRLHVVVDFDGEPEGKTLLNYQDNQFGVPDQMDYLDLLVAQEAGISVEKDPANNHLIVRYPTGTKRVRVHYEVLDRQGNKPFYEYCCYKPIINAQYFHIQSGHLLAAPDPYWSTPEDQKIVQFHWEGFAENQVIHNSFGPGNTQSALITNGQFGSAVFVGGDFRRYSFDVHNKPVYFLTRSTLHNFTDDTLTQLLRRTVEGHRAFWDDFSDSLYTVTFLPIDDAPWSDTSRFTGAGGSGLTNSFLSYGTNNDGLTYELIRYIYVHELMHRWIGIKIENAEDEKQYWFSEGFTEYFTLKNMLRYGLITPEVFLKNFNNDFMSPHYGSPMRLMPNDSINYSTFWSGDKRWEKLPYQRGCVYAFYLDQQLQQHSKGQVDLDIMMREILSAINQNPAQKLNHAFFTGILRKYLGKKGVKDFHKYIEQGKLIEFKNKNLPAGMQVTYKDITLRSGPSEKVITHTEVLKNIPVLSALPGIDSDLLRKSILK